MRKLFVPRAQPVAAAADRAHPRGAARPARHDARSTSCSSRIRSCCARSTMLRERQERARAAQPRARGHEPRRRRAVRRARRAGRPPAARRRDEVALPLQHEPRVPHAAELDPRADAAAARPRRRPLADEQERQVALHPQGGRGPVEPRRTTCSTSRKVEAGKTRRSVPAEFEVDDLFGALRGMLRPLLVERRRGARLRGASGLLRRSTPTRRRSRRSCATSSPTRSSSPSAARCACRRRADDDGA